MRTLMDAREEDKIHLMSITDSVREIQGYLGRADFEAYAQRDDIREAISSQLLQIGGAAALLSDEFKDKYAEVDWDVLKGLQYANFDQELELDLHPQWYIVKNDLPEMMNQIVDLSAQMEREDALTDDLEPTGEAGPDDNLSPGMVSSNKPAFSETDADVLTVVNDFEDEAPYDEDTDEDFDDEDDSLFDEEVDVDTLDVDIEDDSFIDRRFTDDDLMEDSDLDDDDDDFEDEEEDEK